MKEESNFVSIPYKGGVCDILTHLPLCSVPVFCFLSSLIFFSVWVKLRGSEKFLKKTGYTTTPVKRPLESHSLGRSLKRLLKGTRASFQPSINSFHQHWKKISICLSMVCKFNVILQTEMNIDNWKVDSYIVKLIEL